MGGITAPSFYAAFGSKEDLFREAVELYSKTLGVPMMKALAEEPTARASIEALLKAAVESFCRPGKPRGCLLVLGVINSMPANKSVRDHLRRLAQRGGRRSSRSVCSVAWLKVSCHLAWILAPSLPSIRLWWMAWPFRPGEVPRAKSSVRCPLRDGGLGHGGRGSRFLNFLRAS